jgi:hypothetical protein
MQPETFTEKVNNEVLCADHPCQIRDDVESFSDCLCLQHQGLLCSHAVYMHERFVCNYTVRIQRSSHQPLRMERHSLKLRTSNPH